MGWALTDTERIVNRCWKLDAISLLTLAAVAIVLAGPAMLWLRAVVKGHGLFARQTLGLPNQSPRCAEGRASLHCC